jgi:predicted DNA-binding transcriptional regulator AlpA
LRIGMVVRITGLGRSTIYRMMAKADFPSPVRLNNRVVAWRHTDLEKSGLRHVRSSLFDLLPNAVGTSSPASLSAACMPLCSP